MRIKLFEQYIAESQYSRLGQTDAQESAISTIEKWLKKLDKRVSGGDTIGKHPQTVILDLMHHGSEIYIKTNGFEDKETEYGSVYPGVEVYGVHIPTNKDFAIFKKAIETNGDRPKIAELIKELGQDNDYYKDKQKRK